MNRSFFDDRAADEIMPVFLSKAEREKLAIQRREEEAAEKRRALEQLRQQSRPNSSTEPDRDPEREKELEAIKEQYLGLKKRKKRVIKATSSDMNVPYENPHEARRPLFGGGFRAGIDRSE